MKKALLLLFTMAATMMAQGRTLSPEEAIQRVSAEKSGTLAPSRALHAAATTAGQMKLVMTENTTAGTPAVYLFENTAADELLFVAADDVATPLLGYCGASTAAGTEMPPQLKWWLSEYARQIAYAQAAGATTTSVITPIATTSATTTSRNDIAPLVKTTWDQDAPYNNSCPKVGTKATYTGCVATAMAQIMNYFQYPEKGIGTGTATCNNQTLTKNLATITFNWENMLDSYPTATSGTNVQRTAVAQLMMACGYAVNMSYGTSASGAYSSDVPTALTDHFGYDSGVKLVDRKYYTRDQWEEIVYANLEKVGPVYYSGASSSGGGHAFVCDGYAASTGFFHFNWGWSGAYNGYYSLQALNPDGYGIGGFAGGYNFGQDIIINIQKPGGAKIEVNTPTIASASSFTLTASGNNLVLGNRVSNVSSETVSRDLYAKFVPEGGGDPVYIKIYTLNLDPGYGYTGLYIQAGSLPIGVYKVYLETTEVGNTDTYTPVFFPPGALDYTIVTRDSSKIAVINPTIGNVTTTFSKLFTELYYDDTNYAYPISVDVTYTVANNTSVEKTGGIAFMLKSGNTVYAEAAGCYYDLMPGESQSGTLTLQFEAYDYATVGDTYDLYYYDPNKYYSTGTNDAGTKIGTVKLVAYEAGELKATTLGITGDINAVPVDGVPVAGNIMCTKGVYNSTLSAAIFLGNSNISQTQFTKINLKAGESQSITATIVPTAPLQPDTDYTLAIVYIDYTSYSWAVLGSYMDFHTAKSAGIGEIDAENNGINLAYDAATRTLRATSSSAIKSLMVMSSNGMQASAEIETNGTTATADFSALPAGIYIVHATDATGNRTTQKIAIK